MSWRVRSCPAPTPTWCRCCCRTSTPAGGRRNAGARPARSKGFPGSLREAGALGADGSIDLYNDRGNVDLIADVAGYLAPGGAGGAAKAVPHQLPNPANVPGLGTFGTIGDAGGEATAVKMLLVPPTGKPPNTLLGNATDTTAATTNGVVTIAAATAGSFHGTVTAAAEPGVIDELDVQLVRTPRRSASTT